MVLVHVLAYAFGGFRRDALIGGGGDGHDGITENLSLALQKNFLDFGAVTA